MPPPCCWPMPAPRRAPMRCRPGSRRPSMQGAPDAAPVRRSRPSAAKPINIDPELLALYIEEAREEVARIGKLFPAWEQNPLETEALAGVRRAFHTLKGSGRMVGATDISEFAWSIENLLNRIIENTLQRSPAILATVRDAVVMAGELVNALEAGKPAPARAQDIIDRAHALAANRPTAAQTATHGESRAHAGYPAAPTCSKPRGVCPRCRPRRNRRAYAAAPDRSCGARGPGVDWVLDERRTRRRRNRPVDARRRVQCRPAAARDLQPRDPGEHRCGAELRRRRTQAARRRTW